MTWPLKRLTNHFSLTWTIVDSYGSGSVGLAVTNSCVEISLEYNLPSGSVNIGTFIVPSEDIPRDNMHIELRFTEIDFGDPKPNEQKNIP